jgi:hypothetical protein
MARPPGLSVRLKLTLSYAGFLIARALASSPERAKPTKIVGQWPGTRPYDQTPCFLMYESNSRRQGAAAFDQGRISPRRGRPDAIGEPP